MAFRAICGRFVPTAPDVRSSRDLEHRSTATAPTPAAKGSAAEDAWMDRRTHNCPQPGGIPCLCLSQSSTSPAPVGTAPTGQLRQGRQKEKKTKCYGPCFLITLQRSENGGRARRGESHSRDVKQHVPVPALGTVSEESQFSYNGYERSSAADVVCFLNHPLLRGSNKTSIGGAAEGAGAVQSGEEEAERGPYRSPELPERRLY